MRRVPSDLLARGIFDGAMSVYLERFLNVPKQPMPHRPVLWSIREDLLESFDSQGHLGDTGQIVADMVDQGQEDEVIRTLGHAILREGSEFHSFQMFEGGLRQYLNFKGTPMGATS